MDRKDREREMTSQLLTYLHTSGAVAPDQMAQAFTRLLACVEVMLSYLKRIVIP